MSCMVGVGKKERIVVVVVVVARGEVEKRWKRYADVVVETGGHAARCAPVLPKVDYITSYILTSDVNDSLVGSEDPTCRRGDFHHTSTMSTTTETITISLTTSLKLTTQQDMSSPSHPPPHSNPPPKSQKQMTKAERREQQEAQRAAKAAAKATAVQPKPGPSHKQNGSISGKGTSAPSAGTPKKSGKEPATKPGKGEPKEALHSSSQLDETPRGLRIFSHFGAPKPPAITKGDIHPAVIRLGLQFAEFKITGANARCIAMLTAFKTVRPLFPCLALPWSLIPPLGHSRLCDASQQHALSSPHDTSLTSDHTSRVSKTNVNFDGQCNQTAQA